MFAGALTLHSDAPAVAGEASLLPLAFAPARAIAARGGAVVPSLYHQRVTVGPAERALLLACDGTRDVPALAATLAERLKSGELSMQSNGLPVADPAAAGAELDAWLRAALAQFAQVGLLT